MNDNDKTKLRATAVAGVVIGTIMTMMYVCSPRPPVITTLPAALNLPSASPNVQTVPIHPVPPLTGPAATLPPYPIVPGCDITVERVISDLEQTSAGSPTPCWLARPNLARHAGRILREVVNR